MVFLFKAHSLHSNRRVRISPRRGRRLSVHDRILSQWWEGKVPARERPAITDHPMDEIERHAAGA